MVDGCGCKMCTARGLCDARTKEECEALLGHLARQESLSQRMSRARQPVVGTVLECIKA